MLENNHLSVQRAGRLSKTQRGGAAVEFALLVVIFLTLVFGILEIARLIYMLNALQEVTRRAGMLAANSNFDASTLNTIRSAALFSDGKGNLMFGAPVTADHLKIDYLSISGDPKSGVVTPQPISSLPASPAQNYANCLANPYDSGCIRLVRVRVCQPGGDDCTPVPYEMQFPFIDLSALKLPRSETIVPANTLGYRFNSATGL